MSNRGLWLEGGTTFPDRTSRALGIGLAIAWFALIAARNPLTPFASRFECGSDPWDFLHLGEIVELSALGFLVEAHCANAKYSPDGWIELRYAGGRVDVEVRRIDIAGKTHFQIVSIGGVAMP
jgi:hypothetical protein